MQEKTIRFLIVLSRLKKLFVLGATLALNAIMTVHIGYFGFFTPIIIGLFVYLWIDRPALSKRQKFTNVLLIYIFTFLGFIVGLAYLQWGKPYSDYLDLPFLSSCGVILAILYIIGFIVGRAIKNDLKDDPEILKQAEGGNN